LGRPPIFKCLREPWKTKMLQTIVFQARRPHTLKQIHNLTQPYHLVNMLTGLGQSIERRLWSAEIVETVFVSWGCGRRSVTSLSDWSWQLAS
jgi:hypothetical protein